jgi:hypothetical protein
MSHWFLHIRDKSLIVPLCRLFVEAYIQESFTTDHMVMNADDRQSSLFSNMVFSKNFVSSIRHGDIDP